MGKKLNKVYLYNLTNPKIFSLSGDSKFISFLLSKVRIGTDIIKLEKEIRVKFPSVTKRLILETVKSLDKIGALEKNGGKFACDLSPKYLLGLDRQIEFFKEVFPRDNPYEFQKNIKNTRVAILGLGTIAQHIIPPLITSGINNFKCVDFDVVDERNLGRQFLFKKEDIGKLKTDVISDYIKQAKPGIKVESVNEELTNTTQITKIIKDCNIIVHCCDHPRFKIHRMINRACLMHKKPNIVCTPGRLGPFSIPFETACYECLEKLLVKKFPAYDSIIKKLEKDKDVRFPGLAIVVSITGILAAKEIVAHILNFKCETYNGVLRIDPRDLKITRHEVPKQLNCPVCKIKSSA